jgi:hypothetical protein
MGAPVNQRVTVNTNQIIQGAGKFIVDGVEIGSFQGGVKDNINQQETFTKSDYALGEIDGEITSVEAQVVTELEEATLENLAFVTNMGGSSSVLSGVSSKVLELVPDKTLREHEVVFEGQSATNKQLVRTQTYYRCVSIGSRGMSYKRGEKTVIPVTLKCLLKQLADGRASFGQKVDATK